MRKLLFYFTIILSLCACAGPVKEDLEQTRLRIEELKKMVTDIIVDVRSDNSNKTIYTETEPANTPSGKDKDSKPKAKRKAKTQKKEKDNADKASRSVAGFSPKNNSTNAATTASAEQKTAPSTNISDYVGLPCPLCKTGVLIQGRTALGCSRWKEGCTYRLPFEDLKR